MSPTSPRAWSRVALVAALGLAAAGPAAPGPHERQRLEAQAGELHRRALALYRQGKPAEGVGLLQEAVALYRKLYPPDRYPDGHPALATSLNNLGFFLRHAGDYDRALTYYEQALAMRRRLYPKARYPDGHPDLAVTLNNLGMLLEVRGEYGRALGCQEEALAIRQKLYPRARYPDGHRELALGLNNLGGLFQARGDYGRALTYYEQALAMRERLYPAARYPDGHPELASSLNNLGNLLRIRGELDRALPYAERALAMYEKLYPPARHPRGLRDLAASLNNLGLVLQARGDLARAQDCLERALAAGERLYPKERYPNGHPDLARGLSNLGRVLLDRDEAGRGLACLERALAMRERFYPKERYPAGHPDLALSLADLSYLLLRQGEAGRALGHAERALTMFQDLAERATDAASEAEALNYLVRLPDPRGAFLSAAGGGGLPAGRQYALLWRGRAALSEALLRRQRLLRGLPDAESRRLAGELLEARRRLARLLLAPGGVPARERDRLLGELTGAKEKLERDLAARVPEAARRRALARAPHTALAEALPAGAAFIDVYRYERWHRGDRPAPHYAAFVLQRGRPAARVDLGPAEAVEQARTAWRRAVAGGGPDHAEAARVADLLWRPLARELAPGTDTVYLCPDGVVGALPWAAVPGGKGGAVLLEEYTFALVPHGPFLLEQLTGRHAPRPGGGLLLAVGGVAYGRPPAGAGGRKLAWPDLPGTARELDRVVAAAREAGAQVRERRGADAGTARLLEDLPKARWAHLATHGFFAAPDTEARKALLREGDFAFGRRGTREGAGARSPLVLSGLVLAGANLPPRGDVLADDRGLLSGEAIAGLDLRGLDLAVLSACDTGLGEYVSGEGGFGLQRAFHLAGCRDVVATLWQVDDEATAALVALFYRGLWREKLPPREALRRAQLTLYHHPGLVPTLARTRGPDFERAARAAAGPPAGRAPTRLWAAFTLSGAGR